MADGLYYVDSRQPFMSADVAAVTLSTTFKAMIPAGNIPTLGGNYFSMVGKGMRIRLFGRMTTGATPGNGQIALFYGTGADANGVNLASSAVFALTASQTSLTWDALITCRCRSMGATGTLFVTGEFNANPGIVASTLQPLLIPASAPVVSASCDLTASLLLVPQFLRSGSTAETLQVHEVCYESLN